MYSRCKDHDLIDRIVQLRHGHRANKNWAALQTFMQIRRGLWKNSKVAGNAPINQLIQTMERSLVVFLFLLFFFCFLFFFLSIQPCVFLPNPRSRGLIEIARIVGLKNGRRTWRVHWKIVSEFYTIYEYSEINKIK